MDIEVYYDGCCEPVNPGGYAACGVIIKQEDKILWTTSHYVGHGALMSNNVAEYSGIITALEYLLINQFQKNKITFYGDNMMSINQMSGTWKCRGGLYVPYFRKAKELSNMFTNIKFIWIPREQNYIADELSKQILKNNNIKFVIQSKGSRSQPLSSETPIKGR